VRKRFIRVILAVIILFASVVFYLSFKFETLRYGVAPVVLESVPRIARKTGWNYGRLLRKDYPKATDIHFVEEYNLLNQQVFELGRAIETLAAQGHTDTEKEQKWQQLRAEREKIRPFAEAVVEQQVASVVSDEGLKVIFGRILPPPMFIFADSYYILVASPRHEIRFDKSRLLGRELHLSQMDEIETQFELKYPGMVALVQDVGGLAVFYPAYIFHQGSIRELLELSVHEWLHQYLFVASPLGRAFLKGGKMHTINETAVSLLGREIGDKVYMRYYASTDSLPLIEEEFRAYINNLAQRQNDTKPDVVKTEGFEFQGFMRDTYLEAVSLLAQGKVEEAESYMDERRRTLAASGYNIRKINQAYFAFYGSYADSPGAIDPIGPALAKLRLRTTSALEFIRVLRKITSYEEFLQVMDEWQITATGRF